MFFGLASASRGEEKEEGMYFSILGVENSIGGDFKGTVTGGFVDSTVLIRIPEIKNGSGFGILIGGYTEKLAGELYYSCSKHDTSFKFYDLNCNGFNDGGAEDTVYYQDGECQVFGANAKWFFANLFDSNFRFFGQLGFFVPKISMEHGAYQEDDVDDTADVSFTGYGVDLGLGVIIHLHPKWAITGSSVYRYIRIKEATAFGEDRIPSDTMVGSGWSYSVGINYYF
ncbi:MAG: hypothetical protein GXY86_01095 [Firmicutes bacterium]|nr:hypothetical protein [Bacillota bacterium]